jgi:hypothetical protein
MVRVHLKSKVTSSEEGERGKPLENFDLRNIYCKDKVNIITLLHFGLSIVEACSIQETIRRREA